MYTKICSALSRICMWLGVSGLVLLIAAVTWQVFGRYVLNNTPTWAESLSLLLVLYVTMFGVAVGVRDAGHIGLESLVSLLPESLRLKVEVLIHALVAAAALPSPPPIQPKLTTDEGQVRIVLPGDPEFDQLP